MTSLADILQIIFAGLTSGGIYAMTALGLVIVFNVARLINLAQGEFYMIGCLTAVFLHATLHLPLWAAVPGAVIISMLLSILMERLAIRPVSLSTPSIQLLVTVGVSSIAQGAAALIWGLDPFSLPPFWNRPPLQIFGASVPTQTVIVLSTLLILTFSLWVFFERTMFGKSLRACADNPLAAQLIGLSVTNLRRVAFGLSGFLGALSGVLILPLIFADYASGLSVSIKAFMAAAFGGMGGAPGAVIGGLSLGLLESLTAGFISSTFRDAIAFSAVLVLLLIRPSGLMGRSDP